MRSWTIPLAPIFLVPWLVAALAGCDRPPAQPGLLASVGQVQIAAEDLRVFESRLGEGEQGDHRTHLQTLVDREVLLLEARALGLQEDGQVLRELAESEERELAQAMLRQQLEEAVVSDEEVARAHAEQKGWDIQAVALEIFVLSADRARQVIELLRRGEDFAEVARQHAVDPHYRVLSGAARQVVYSPFDHPRDLVEAIFSLEPGGFTQPVPWQGGFAIAALLERRPAALDEVGEGIRKVLLEEKRKQLRHSYLRHLKWDFGTRFHPEGMDLVLAALRAGRAPDSLDALRQPVYSFDGFAMDVEEVLKVVEPAHRTWPELSADQVNEELAQSHFPNKLMARDALRKGIDQSEAFQRWRRSRQEDLMLARLRQQVVAAVEVSQEDLEAFYEANKHRFRTPAWARIQEVLVEGEAQAQKLAEQVVAGADMGALARTHSLSRKGEEGILDVSASQAPLYGEAWMEAVMEAPLDQLRGPLQSRGGYSLFKVLERHPEHFFTLESATVLQAVKRDVRQQKIFARFNRYVEEMRQKYEDQIQIYEESLEHFESQVSSVART